MRWLPTEYLLKGAYLGLVLYAALLQAVPAAPANPVATLARVNLATLAGLALALAVAAGVKLRQGYQVRGRLIPFLLFLILESPTLVYAGILGGTLAGVLLLGSQGLGDLLLPTVGGGALVGGGLGLLRQVRDRLARIGLILAVAAGLVAAALLWLGKFGSLEPGRVQHLAAPTVFAVQLLLGLPFLYLLTFAGQEEESEVEIGASCGVLGLGLAILLEDHVQARSLAFILPVALYFLYTMRVLPGLRVLKHAFRGLSYARVGRHRRALLAFRRALQLDPNNRFAREGFWHVHHSLDLDHLAHDPETLAVVDLDLCLERAGSLLLNGRPTPTQLAEALRLLDMVVMVRPERQPGADYWRAVAHTHEKQYDRAAGELVRVLDPAVYGADNPHRQAVLLPAWQLALTLHEELRRRAGAPQLAEPGRRMEAIAAVERHLRETPDDPAVAGLKELLYRDLTEADYDAFAGPGKTAPDFDHALVQQLGQALIGDEASWARGAEYLRLAVRGLPTLGPGLFTQVAQACQRAGRIEEAVRYYEMAKRAGLAVGQKSLPEPERQAYFAAVKLLAEDAAARDDVDAAIENYQLFAESERAGLETLRTLAGLWERRGDALTAARFTDQALVAYAPKDRDLLERKDRYYFSVMPDQLQARLDAVRGWFDVAYCLQKARSILDGRNTDSEWLEVADHLLQLARVVHPESLTAKVLLARVLLRYGERERALALLEEVRSPKPEKFASAEENDSWFVSCQVLGDLYLEMGRPDQAVACFQDFRQSTRSGARTLFKLGQAYEQLGDLKRAARCYQGVTAYEDNPLAPEAHDALARLGGGV